MISQVEKLGAEVQTCFAPGQRELLDDREVGVHKIGSGGWDTRGVAEFASRRRNKTCLVDPLVLAVVAGGGVAVGDPIGPVVVETVAAGIEGNARGVVAVDQW